MGLSIRLPLSNLVWFPWGNVRITVDKYIETTLTTKNSILTTPNDIETVFRDSHTHLKANSNDSGHYMYQLLGVCLGLISGQEWRLLRKATEAPFTRTATTSYVDGVLNHANQHIPSLCASKPEKWHLRPQADLRVYPFLALADILYGTLSPNLKARLLTIIPGRDSVFAHMMMGGVTRYAWAKYLPLQANREMRSFKQAWARWNDDAHSGALVKATEKRQRPVPIIAMYAAVSNGSISREALLQTLDECSSPISTCPSPH
ncbi:hypothetical protein N0V83_010059 [Neocucurbitaria cava]|uniref:Uncharacterized protein n=1 Tax=Neocucurbitaria cava TaxID=798079 RepID=A0A9W8Y006_9PLEO|nr:hypothetical protein N0V83_010059 [Neocucurbitaria cava]